MGELFQLFKPNLPVNDEQRLWVDSSFERLATLLGRERPKGKVILPDEDCFPDPYDGSEQSARLIFGRVAFYLGVPPDSVHLHFFSDIDTVTRGLAPLGAGESSGAGGFYYGDGFGQLHVAIHENKLGDPLALVATLAHELGHVLLLAPRLVGRDEPDMEPLTDLLTVFLGFGVFNANSAFHFQQYTTNGSQGWSTSRSGYLSEEMYGYALARYAWERGERKPFWAGFLSRNVRSYFQRSAAWLAQNERPNAA